MKKLTYRGIAYKKNDNNNSSVKRISGRVNQVRSNNENFQTVNLKTKFLSGSIFFSLNEKF